MTRRRSGPEPGGFARATAVSSLDPELPGRHRFAAAVRPGWDIAGNANGGYLLAIAARAVGQAVGRPDPVTVTAHYLAPGQPGPVVVDVEVVKQGRRFATASAALVTPDGRPVLRLVGAFGTLGGPEAVDGDVSLVDVPPPDLPPVDECVPMVSGPAAPDGAGGAGDGGGTGPAPSFAGRVDLRIHPEDAWFLTGRPSGTARMRGWFRFPGGEPVDTLGLLQASDAFPPTVFNAALPVAWTPTVELTTHVRARPAPGWLRCRFVTHFVTGGFLEEDGEIWDATDRLVAQSRQLALVPRGGSGIG